MKGLDYREENNLYLRKLALGEINGEKTGYPSKDKPWLKYYSEEMLSTQFPKTSIYEFLLIRNKDHLNDVAINYFDNRITYKSIFKNIDLAAEAFAAMGIKKNDIVLICSVTTPETIYSIYALNKIGSVCNMVDPRTSVEGIIDYAKETKSKYIITLDTFWPKIKKVDEVLSFLKIVTLSPFDSLKAPKKIIAKLMNKQNKVNDTRIVKWENLLDQRKNQNEKIVSLGNELEPCVIEHTGGTTGNPKGVVLSNENLNTGAANVLNSPLRLKRNDKFLNIMPPFIAYGMVLGVHAALSAGWESVLIPNFDVNEFDSLILKYKPAGIMGVPTHFENLMKSEKLKNKDLSFLKVVLVGGDKADVEFEKKVNNFFGEHKADLRLSKGYSMTESSATATFSFEECNKFGSSGIPLFNTIVSAFEIGTDNELKFNTEGEICICSNATMLGYYNLEDETKKVLKVHSDGKVWIHSGDLGYLDEDGCIFINGRMKRMIIRHDGFKVFPSFIENIVITDNEVETCCVVGTRDKEHTQGSLPVVFAVLTEKSRNNENTVKERLKGLCKKELPEYAQPIDYIFKEKLPLTKIGKIDYRALEKELEM